jgi:halimadienyl-diphosphate synthase
VIEELLKRRVAELMTTMASGETSHSDYDAGWVARVRVPTTGELAFPEVLDVVRARQRADGSWGPEVPYASARVISTLSSVLALTSTEGSPEDALRVERGVDYLCREWDLALADPALSIGFELLAASLLQDACTSGLRKLERFLPEALALRNRKLAKIPRDLIYSPKLSAGFSLEFVGSELDAEKARGLQLTNGSIAGNIAATAFYHSMTQDPVAYECLRRCVARHGAGGIPYGDPSDLFPRIWVLHNLEAARLIDPQDVRVQEHIDVIARAFGPKGVGWSSLVDYGDADDTGLAVALLAWSGRPCDCQALRSYEGPGWFHTYFGETDASVGANAHVLMALALVEESPWRAAAVEKIIGFLRSQRRPLGFWVDKWHASPYYATACVLHALRQSGRLREDDVPHDWVLTTQYDDGSWGYFGRGNPEETSYALMTLLAGVDREERPIRSAIERALDYLMPFVNERWDADAEPLWLSKTLYAPRQIVQSAILHACKRAHERLRGSM